MSSSDVLYGLKYIALHRTELCDKSVSISDLTNYAKWQLCQARNILWLDPIWEKYTQEEILIEFFSMRFDLDEKLREEFKKTTIAATSEDLDWFDKMEKKMLTEASPQKDIIKEEKTEEITPLEEFEDKY